MNRKKGFDLANRLVIILAFVSITANADPNTGCSTEAVKSLLATQDANLLSRTLAVGIVCGGKVSTVGSSGGESKEHLFEIGSISKSFAGIVAAELSLEGKLDLDKPISTYVTQSPLGPFVGNVTARQLATHLARLPDGFIDPKTGTVSETYSEEDLIRFLQTYVPGADFPPGKRQYSDIGFATLGLVMSQIEGKPYPDIVRERILRPLKMKSSDFITTEQAPHRLLQGYNVVLEPLAYTPESELATASGGIYSNLDDMMKFLKHCLTPDHSFLSSAIKKSEKEGLGWDSDPFPNPLPPQFPINKNGAMTAGFSSWLKFDPQTGVGMIVLANDLDISATLALGETAFERSPGSNAYQDLPQTSDFVSSSAGAYFSADGQQEIDVFSVGTQFLGVEEKTGFPKIASEGLYRWRLMAIAPNEFYINDGTQMTDFVFFKADPITKQVSLIYVPCDGSDSSGQCIYDKKMVYEKH